jgi:hypothetical protein
VPLKTFWSSRSSFSCFKSPNSVGIVPENLFPCTAKSTLQETRTSICVRSRQSDAEQSRKSRFPDPHIRHLQSEDRRPISDGSLSRKVFRGSSSTSNLESRPNSLGKAPAIPALSARNSKRLVKPPNSTGILPNRRFSERVSF